MVAGSVCMEALDSRPGRIGEHGQEAAEYAEKPGEVGLAAVVDAFQRAGKGSQGCGISLYGVQRQAERG